MSWVHRLRSQDNNGRSSSRVQQEESCSALMALKHLLPVPQLSNLLPGTINNSPSSTPSSSTDDFKGKRLLWSCKHEYLFCQACSAPIRVLQRLLTASPVNGKKFGGNEGVPWWIKLSCIIKRRKPAKLLYKRTHKRAAYQFVNRMTGLGCRPILTKVIGSFLNANRSAHANEWALLSRWIQWALKAAKVKDQLEILVGAWEHAEIPWHVLRIRITDCGFR